MPETLPQPAQIASRRAAPDVVGAVRRLRALAVAAWTRPYLAAELRIAECHLGRVYAGRISFPQLAVRVRTLYDHLVVLEAPYTPAARITRGRALANGWLGPDAWTPSTIDDPQGRPLTGTMRARIEDLQWMVDTGEGLAGACRRLHLEAGTLYSSLERAHRTDLWQRLAAREAA